MTACSWNDYSKESVNIRDLLRKSSVSVRVPKKSLETLSHSPRVGVVITVGCGVRDGFAVRVGADVAGAANTGTPCELPLVCPAAAATQHLASNRRQ